MPESNDFLVMSDFVPDSPALSGVGLTLGEGDNSDVALGRISLRIGRRPRAIPLVPLARRSGKTISDDFHLLLRAYEPWIMFYTIGIQDTGDWRNVARFGLKVQLMDQPSAGVAAVFPESSCLRLGAGKAVWRGAFGVSGSLSAGLDGDQGGDETANDLLGPLASLGVRAGLSSSADVTLRMSFDVVTPLVTTTGANDDTTQWTFVRGTSDILTGDQTLGHILLLPKPAMGPVMVRATLFADIGLLWVFTKRFTTREPVTLEINLPA